MICPRNPYLPWSLGLYCPSSVNWRNIEQEVDRDPFLSKIKQDILGGHQYASYSIERGQLLYKGRMVLSKDSPFINQLLKEYRDTALGGHNGELKTYLRLATNWFWVKMRSQVTQYVRS